MIDNTGVTRAELINVYKVKTKAKKSVGVGTVGEYGGFCADRTAVSLPLASMSVRWWLIVHAGDEIRIVVKKSRPVTQSDKPNVQRLRKGDMAKAVIVRVRKSEMRPDGTQIR